MTQYGSGSAIFRIYNQVNSVVLGNIYTNGVDNALTGVQPVVRQDCVGRSSRDRGGDQGMMTSVEETTRTDVTGIPSRWQRSST
jgi:hypothetical protein